MPGVVVTVRAQRLPQYGVRGLMNHSATQRLAVRAPPATTGSMTAAGTVAPQVLATGGVHSPEPRCGQRGEHRRMLGHRRGHLVMPTGEPSMDQLPGVPGVEIRTRRAHRRAAVLAPPQHFPLPPEPVHTHQMHRPRAVPRCLHPIPPLGVSRRGHPAHHLIDQRRIPAAQTVLAHRPVHVHAGTIEAGTDSFHGPEPTGPVMARV